MLMPLSSRKPYVFAAQRGRQSICGAHSTEQIRLHAERGGAGSSAAAHCNATTANPAERARVLASLLRNLSKHIRPLFCDPQQGQGWSARLAPSLFPILHRAQTDTH